MGKSRYKQRKTNRTALKDYLNSFSQGTDTIETLQPEAGNRGTQDFLPEDSGLQTLTEQKGLESNIQQKRPEKPTIDDLLKVPQWQCIQ